MGRPHRSGFRQLGDAAQRSVLGASQLNRLISADQVGSGSGAHDERAAVPRDPTAARIALRYVAGPAAALSEVDALETALVDYHLFHATRAELLRDLNRTDEARDADQRALTMTANPAEQSLLRQRLTWT